MIDANAALRGPSGLRPRAASRLATGPARLDGTARGGSPSATRIQDLASRVAGATSAFVGLQAAPSTYSRPAITAGQTPAAARRTPSGLLDRRLRSAGAPKTTRFPDSAPPRRPAGGHRTARVWRECPMEVEGVAGRSGSSARSTALRSSFARRPCRSRTPTQSERCRRSPLPNSRPRSVPRAIAHRERHQHARRDASRRRPVASLAATMLPADVPTK